MLRNLGVFKYKGSEEDKLKSTAIEYLDEVIRTQLSKNDIIDKNTSVLAEKVKAAIKKENLEFNHEFLSLAKAAALLDDPVSHYPVLAVLFKMGIKYTQEDIDWTRTSRLCYTAEIMQKYYDENIALKKMHLINKKGTNMKKILLMLLICGMNSIYAHELKSFGDIYKSIQAGKNIRMIINFDNCSPKPPVANILVYTAPTAIMVRKNYLQFSNSPLTTNNPHYLKIPVLENCTYKISENNEVNIVTRVITLPAYAINEEMSSICKLGVAVRVFN